MKRSANTTKISKLLETKSAQKIVDSLVHESSPGHRSRSFVEGGRMTPGRAVRSRDSEIVQSGVMVYVDEEDFEMVQDWLGDSGLYAEEDESQSSFFFPLDDEDSSVSQFRKQLEEEFDDLDVAVEMKEIKSYGVLVTPRSSSDRSEIEDWLEDSGLYGEWNNQEGGFFFPCEDREEVLSLKRELRDELSSVVSSVDFREIK